MNYKFFLLNASQAGLEACVAKPSQDLAGVHGKKKERKKKKKKKQKEKRKEGKKQVKPVH